MKATGIVRRIDDLGRIVIPKEIRRTMKLHEGAALEIYTDREEQIILKKYSPVGELAAFAQKLCESMAQAGSCAVICDRDKVIAAAGGYKKELLGQTVSSGLQEIMNERVQYIGTAPISDELKRCMLITAAPIITDGDVSGCVMFAAADRTKATEAETAMAAAGAMFLGKETGE